MAWQDEIVPMVRVLINDFGSTPKYTDERLTDAVVVAAQIICREITFSRVYTVSMSAKSISPDPVSVNDDTFISLLTLKSACFVDQSTMRTKAEIEGVKANLGPVSIDVSGQINAFLQILENGPCKMYEDLKMQIQFGSDLYATNIRAILTPFVGNKFHGPYYSEVYKNLR